MPGIQWTCMRALQAQGASRTITCDKVRSLCCAASLTWCGNLPHKRGMLHAYLAKVIVIIWLQNALVGRREGVGVDELVRRSVGNGSHHLCHASLICSWHPTAQHGSCARTAKRYLPAASAATERHIDMMPDRVQVSGTLQGFALVHNDGYS